MSDDQVNVDQVDVEEDQTVSVAIGAATELVLRTGADSVEIRMSEPIEEHLDVEGHDCPYVFLAVACYAARAARTGYPVKPGKQVIQAGAGQHPLLALHSLLDILIDGGVCKSCGRPTAVLHDPDEEAGLLLLTCCIWRYSPADAAYLRDCVTADGGTDASP